VFAGALAFGQAAAINGQIEGTITDPAGAVVPNAKVEVTNDDTGYKRSAQTDSAGFYRLGLLPLGPYTLTVDASGFPSEQRQIATLSAGQTATLNLGLSVGTGTVEITVTDAAPVVEPGRTDIGSTLGRNAVENLALVSRNPYNFILNQPNVSGSPNV